MQLKLPRKVKYKMQFKEEGVLLTFDEYTDYQKVLHALAALRPATSFNTDSHPKVVTVVEVEP